MSSRPFCTGSSIASVGAVANFIVPSRISAILCGFVKAKKNAGEMAEWLKAHAWKACIGLYPIRGSNPRLSAKKEM